MKTNRTRGYMGRLRCAGLSCGTGLVFLMFTGLLQAAERQVVHGYVQQVTAGLTAVRPMDTSQQLNLVIGLPVRDAAGLTSLLQQLYDSASPRFKQWQSPEQLAAQFGATDKDLQAVAEWAKANGLAVNSTHANKLVMEVQGTVGDIQKALHIALKEYKHPTEDRTFYAPDTQPSLDLAVPVLTIDGLDNFAVPQHSSQLVTPEAAAAMRTKLAELKPQPGPSNASDTKMTPSELSLNGGSGPGGNYAGCDFRAAYVPGVALDGTGQNIGLLQYNNFYQADITAYETNFGIPNVPIIGVPVAGGFGAPSMPGNDEVSLDIEAAIAMAPGAAAVYVYNAPNLIANWVPLLSRMQTDNYCKQLSCSWFGGAPNPTAENIFQLMAAQGQSFFNASGDFNAWTNVAPYYIPFPCQSPNITQVGGTTLSTAGPCGAYGSEVVWNIGLFNGRYWGTAGGLATDFTIPWWQESTPMGPALGSGTARNIPDVALTANNVWVIYNNGASGGFMGTSCAAPLWAGFMALVNQQAMTAGRAPVGFLNPPMYAIGNSASYANTMHDITIGNNYWPSSPTHFPAVAGYDLCTGWGSPRGQALINYLAGEVIAAPALVGNGDFETGDFTSWNWGGNTNSTFVSTAYDHGGVYGAQLGPVTTLGSLSQTISTVAGQSYVLSFWLWNPGGGSGTEFKVVWNGTVLMDLVNSTSFGWTNCQFNVVASGSSSTLEFDYRNDPSYWGLDSIGVAPTPQITVEVANGGFESGSFASWAQGGNTGFTSVSAGYAHSGAYGAQLGPSGSIGTLSQTIRTIPGQNYVLSFWLENPSGGSTTIFKAIWNGSTLMNLSNAPATSWTKQQFTVTATGFTTVLEFDFQNDPGYWGLDDIAVSPLNSASGLTFDDLPAAPTALLVPDQYGGVMWDNFYYVDGDHYNLNPSGYGAGVVSPVNIAYNGFANPATISNAVPFNLNSAMLTAAWNDNLQVEAKGFLHGVLIYDTTYTLSATVPTLINFNYRGVTEVRFISSGGTQHPGYPGSGTHFAIENVVITVYQGLTFDDLPVPVGNAVVPEGYGDLNWNNFYYLDGVHYSTPSGYLPGAVSQDDVAFNGSGNPASIVSAVPFNLNSAYLTAAWNDNLQVEAKGYLHGALVYDRTYILSATVPSLIDFNFLGVTEVDFISSGGTPHGYPVGSGTHFAIDNINRSYPLPEYDAAYLRSTVGEPWGTVNSDTAMNRVFGTNQWQDLRYESVNTVALFTPATHFIYMEGSDDNWLEMLAFLNANMATIQNWVNNGGTLFINAAPNEGSGGNIGFGVSVLYNAPSTLSARGTAVDPANALFSGPFAPVGTTWTAAYFAHATLDGDGGMIPLITGTNGLPVLAELWVGSGHVLVGTMTEDIFHSPQPQASNLRANILAYAGGAAGTFGDQGTFDELPYPGSIGLPVPSGYLGVNWNNFSYLDGVHYSGNPSGYQVGTVSTNNCAYNANGTPASITSPNPFDLHSAYFTAAWNDNLQLRVQGYNRGTLVYDQTYTLLATMPTLINLEFLGVTEVDFTSSGGVDHTGYGGTGTHFAMDNILLATGNAVASGIDHFVWSAVPSPECVGAGFAVTLTAKDANNATVTSFGGNVNLTGWAGGTVLDSFDTGVWPHAPWVAAGAAFGASAAAYTHDGPAGFSDAGNPVGSGDWYYRTDVSVGAAGDVVSWWVRPGPNAGRAYLGIAAGAGGAWSVVAAPNTSEFIIQKNIPLSSFTEVVSEDQTWVLGKWYKVVVQFTSPTSINAYLYDSDGQTLLHMLSYSGITGAPGGLAMRCFNNFSVDSLQRGSPALLSVTPALSGNFVNGVWSGTVRVLQPGSPIVLTANEGSRGPAGTSNPFTVNPLSANVTQVAGGVNVCWNSCAGGHYQLQRKNGNIMSAWSNLGGVVTAAGSSTCVFVAMPPPASDYFRIIAVP